MRGVSHREGDEASAQRAEGDGWGSWTGGSEPLSPPSRGSGSAVSRVPGGAPENLKSGAT